MDVIDLLYAASTWIIPVLFAVTLHEAAHGFAAWRLGDDTAYRQGRVTLNPLNHVDPFGTILFPALLLLIHAPFLFGWAKPVPVAFHRLHAPRRDMVLVAAAGPGTNLFLATLAALLFRVVGYLPGEAAIWSSRVLANAVELNLVLAVFNMLPLPPLDGGRVAAGLLPAALGLRLARLERYGMLIVVGAVFILPMIGRQLGVDLDVLRWLVGVPVDWLLPFFGRIAGLN